MVEEVKIRLKLDVEPPGVFGDNRCVDYYFLKLGPGSSFAIPLLEDEILGEPAAVVLNGNATVARIESQKDTAWPRASKQAIDAYRWSHGEISATAVTVANGKLWLTEPSGPMKDLTRAELESVLGPIRNKKDSPKVIPLRVIHRESLEHVPAVLAQITVNRQFAGGSFRKIAQNFGLLAAMDHVLFKAGIQTEYPHIGDKEKDFFHLLQCLAPNDLIELVSRTLQEQGFFVPGLTGGFVKDIDLFVYNDTGHELAAGAFHIPPRDKFRSGARTIQVRGMRKAPIDVLPVSVDYVFQLNGHNNGAFLNSSWLQSNIKTSPSTAEWLERILRWLPFAGQIIEENS